MNSVPAVPAEVKAIIGGYSNEAKLALLERRFHVPASPAVSREEVSRGTSLLNPTHSAHSVGSARVQPTVADTPSASGRSTAKHTLDAVAGGGDSLDGVTQPAKRRKVQQQLAVPGGGGGAAQQQQQAAGGGGAAAGGGGARRGASPPSSGQLPRPSLSPFLAGADGAAGGKQQPGKLTPSSKQKQRNSISRRVRSPSLLHACVGGVGLQ